MNLRYLYLVVILLIGVEYDLGFGLSPKCGKTTRSGVVSMLDHSRWNADAWDDTPGRDWTWLFPSHAAYSEGSNPHNRVESGIGRRQSIFTATSTVVAMLSGLSINPPLAGATETVSQSPGMEVSAKDILSRLGSIPTFVLVQGDTGVPFMIFNGEAAATGYFFLSYNIAEQALRDAREKDKQQGAANIWNAAQIRVVPLSIAMQLALSTNQRAAVNEEKGVQGIKLTTYGDIVVSEEGNIDAKRLDSERNNNPGKWSSTKGRVPVFYVNGMTLANGKQPWYFNIADLKAEYKRQQLEQGNENAVLPNDRIQVVEMMNVFRAASRRNEWSVLSNVVIVPVKESKQVAVKLVKETASGASPYNFDKVFLVSSSK